MTSRIIITDILKIVSFSGEPFSPILFTCSILAKARLPFSVIFKSSERAWRKFAQCCPCVLHLIALTSIGSRFSSHYIYISFRCNAIKNPSIASPITPQLYQKMFKINFICIQASCTNFCPLQTANRSRHCRGQNGVDGGFPLDPTRFLLSL